MTPPPYPAPGVNPCAGGHPFPTKSTKKVKIDMRDVPEHLSRSDENRKSEYQYRFVTDGPMPDDWDLAWDDDRSVVEEEAEVARAIGMTGVRIETRLRPICPITWREKEVKIAPRTPRTPRLFDPARHR